MPQAPLPAYKIRKLLQRCFADNFNKTQTANQLRIARSSETKYVNAFKRLLKEIAPGVTRAAVLRDPAITSGIGQFAVIQYVSRSVGVEVSPVDVDERSLTWLGRTL